MELTRDILRQLPFSLQVEIEENTQRKSLTQTELAHQQGRILNELRKHTVPGARNDLQPTSAKGFAEVRPTAVVGKIFNESHRQVEKRLAIVAAAEAEPAKYGKLADDMDSHRPRRWAVQAAEGDASGRGHPRRAAALPESRALSGDRCRRGVAI
jgi:hypothetical protein